MTARTALLFLNASKNKKVQSHIHAALKSVNANVQGSLYVHIFTHPQPPGSTTTSSLLLFNLLFLLLTKKFFLTQPWVVLFSNSGLDQSLENLCIRRRTCAVPRKVLFFCSSTLLIVPGIWASQPGNLSAVASTAPTTTGITIILTFCSYSSF